MDPDAVRLCPAAAEPCLQVASFLVSVYCVRHAPVPTAAAASSGATAAPSTRSKASFFAVHDRLKQMAAELGSFRTAERILRYVVFNACAGLLEGLARVKKWSDAGRQAFHRDAVAIAKLYQGAVPSIAAALIEWLLRFAEAFASPSGTGVIEFRRAAPRAVHGATAANSGGARRLLSTAGVGGAAAEAWARGQTSHRVDRAPFVSRSWCSFPPEFPFRPGCS